MSTEPDILDLIDATLSCVHCSGPLGDGLSPSGPEACQVAWQAGHGEPLPLPSGLLVTPRDMTEEEADDFRRRWQDANEAARHRFLAQEREADLTVATAAARLRPRLAEALYIEVDTAELERRLGEVRAAAEDVARHIYGADADFSVSVEETEYGEAMVTIGPPPSPDRRRGDPMRGWLAGFIRRVRGGGR